VDGHPALRRIAGYLLSKTFNASCSNALVPDVVVAGKGLLVDLWTLGWVGGYFVTLLPLRRVGRVSPENH
jgi:hypothetical protein